MIYGRQMSSLRDLAIRVLSKQCGIGACERGHKKTKQYLSKSRQSSTKIVSEQVFISANQSLLDKVHEVLERTSSLNSAVPLYNISFESFLISFTIGYYFPIVLLMVPFWVP